MSAAPTFVTWFHADDAARAGTYSQIRGSAGSSQTYEVYLRCVDVSVASFHRWNPGGRSTIVLNPAADGLIEPGRRALWERVGARAFVAENTHQPEVDLFGEWQNQFFLFDVIRAAVEQDGDADDALVVLDSDVLVQAPLDGLAEAIAARGRVAMRIPYPEDVVANGSSRLDLQRFVEQLQGTPLSFVPSYQGGEFVAGTRAALAALVDACQTVYDWSIERQIVREPHPNEEAHMISVASPLDDGSTDGNRWIERMWTKPWNLRLLPPSPERIPLWHLPAEKKTGFRQLHDAVVRPDSWFWQASDLEWRRRASGAVGVPTYGPAKLVKDLVALRADVMPAVRSRLSARR